MWRHRQNAGVLRCAQNDKLKQTTTSAATLWFLLFLLADSAALVEHAHGVREILWGDDADDAVAVEDGHHLRSGAGHDAAEGFDEGVVGLRGLEGAGHNALDVAVAVRLEGFDDALTGDGADECGAADDGEDVLQRVDGALECVLEGVGGGEHGELCEHDVAHADSVRVGLQEEALVFHVGADHDEGSEHDEPHVGEQKAADDEAEGDGLAESCGCAATFDDATGFGELATEDTATVEGRCREEVDGSEEEVDPDGGAEQMRRGDPGTVEEIDLRSDGQDYGGEKEAEADVGDGANYGHALLDFSGVVSGFRGGVTLQASGGEEQDAAEFEVEPCGGNGAGYFANDDGE